MADLQVESVEGGEILVIDPAAGHQFRFRLVTERGTQTLSAMVPEWHGGEPAGAHGLTLEARALADAEARDQGWIDGGDPDVG